MRTEHVPMTRPFLSVLVVFCWFGHSPAQERGQEQGNAETFSASDWHTRYDSAVTEAKEEGKDLFLVFTGTEWIDICRRFEDEILKRPEFAEPVSEKFSLLKLEFPENNRLPKGEAKQKQLLRDAYRVRGFPTVILTDAEGRPFGVNGYQPATPTAYASQILAIERAHEQAQAAREAAEELEGLEKAEKLGESIPDLPGNLAARYYRDEMEAAMEADPNGALEQTARYRRLIADVEYSIRMQELAEDVQWGRMIELTDAYIRDNELEGGTLQKALLNKAGIQQRQSNTAGMIETLLRVVEIDPESGVGREAQRRLDQMRVERLQEDLAPQSDSSGDGAASPDVE